MAAMTSHANALYFRKRSRGIARDNSSTQSANTGHDRDNIALLRTVPDVFNIFCHLFLAPVPGGCCLTCTMEIDPNIVITRKQYYKSVLSFSLANIYDYNNSDCSGQIQFGSKPPDHYRLQYSIYQYFLEEGNLKNDELFDGLSKMLTPAEVKENGKKVQFLIMAL